jgi:hypothetical protein
MRGVESGQFPLPTMTIIDVALLSREEHLVYDARRIVSSERVIPVLQVLRAERAGN